MHFNDRDEIIALTPQWKGERFDDGRPKVDDKYLKALKNLTLEEVWKPIFVKGYESQFEGRLNESILTGESEPVVKHTGDILLSGSSVISGKCSAEVTCENEDSFTSKIANEVKSTKQSGSEMLMSMKKVTKFTGFFIIPLGILMFIQGYFFRNMPLAETVISTSAGLLEMLPKGLVLLISIGFAAGVINLSKKQVLVRELHSLENLAHCDTICLDKTGTLTEGKLSVEKVFTDIDSNKFEKLMSAYIKYTQDNNSTFLALKNYFKCTDTYECTACVPFSSERKYSSVTLDNGQSLVIGAPEKLCKDIPSESQYLYAVQYFLFCQDIRELKALKARF